MQTSPDSRQPFARARRLQCWLLALAACGCDAQAANDYRGESMFQMRARVELALENAQPDLVPALAWVNPEAATIHFVDTAVTGEFPANFELKVYTPPPSSALGGYPTEDLPGEPRFAVGPIAAVTRDHVPVAYLHGFAEAELQSCEADVCTWSAEVHSAHSNRLANITYTCPASHAEDPFASELDCNVTEKSGDPVVGLIPDPEFPGFSDDYLVLYLEHAAPAGGYAAFLFGAPDEGLAPGYHLLSRRARAMDEWIASRLCFEDALDLALDRYNTEHGMYPSHGIELVCEPGGDATCGATDSQRALRGAWYRAQVELGCAIGRFAYAPVPDAATAPITVHVAPGQVLPL